MHQKSHPIYSYTADTVSRRSYGRQPQPHSAGNATNMDTLKKDAKTRNRNAQSVPRTTTSTDTNANRQPAQRESTIKKKKYKSTNGPKKDHKKINPNCFPITPAKCPACDGPHSALDSQCPA